MLKSSVSQKVLGMLIKVAWIISAVLIGLAYLMDRSAIMARINGANGLPLLAAFIVSFLGSLLLAVIMAFMDGWLMLFKVIGVSLVYHLLLMTLMMKRLEYLAQQVVAKMKG